MIRPSLSCAHAALLAFALVAICISQAFAIMPPRPATVDKDGNVMPPAKGITAEVPLEELLPFIHSRFPGRFLSAKGTLNLPVICMDFLDVGGGPGNGVSTAIIDSLMFSNQIYPGGSVRDYYQEVSNGTLTVTGQVYGWYLSPAPQSYYLNYAGGVRDDFPRNTQGLVTHAVAAADPVADFSQYDNDGDGFVDCVIIVHKGLAAEFWNPPNSYVWFHSHLGWLSAGVTGPGPILVDGVRVELYILVSDRRHPNMSVPPYYRYARGIGVFCHEIGHALGLPDFYSTASSSYQLSYGRWWGLGTYCLMAYGGWGAGGNNPDRPHHLSGFAKAYLGWSTPVHVTVNLHGATIPAVQTGGQVFCSFPFQNHAGWDVNLGQQPPSRGPFPPLSDGWIIENRQQTGFDSSLPGSGLLIYHLDGMVALRDYDRDGTCNFWDNDVMWSEQHPLLDVECADQTGGDHTFNADDLDALVNGGDATDFWYAGNDSGFHCGVGANPKAVYYTGIRSQFQVRNISASGPNMTADILVGVLPGPNHDVWVKDCTHDDGSVSSGPNCNYPMYRQQYASPDVWIDNDLDGYVDRSPVQGTTNNLFFKVRNRGAQSSDFARLMAFELTGLMTQPSPLPSQPSNPFHGFAQICSTTVYSLQPGDSGTVQVMWNVPASPPPPNWNFPPSIGLLVDTASDTLNGSGDVAQDNNLAMLSGRELWMKAVVPAKGRLPGSMPDGVLAAKQARRAASTRARSKDEPAEPLVQAIPINNPQEIAQDFIIDFEADLPPHWVVTLELPEMGGGITTPHLLTLQPLEVTPLLVTIDPGPAGLHGETGLGAVLQYDALLYPAPEGLVGSMSFPIEIDLLNPLPVASLNAHLEVESGCYANSAGIRLEFPPVAYDISGVFEDISYYAIFRDTVPDMDIDLDGMLGKCAVDADEATPDWDWIDAGWPVNNAGPSQPWYRVVAVDEAGNLAEPSEPAAPDLPFDYGDHTINNMRLTVTDQGILGYMEPDGRGRGLQWPQGDPSLIWTGGVWAGSDPTYVASRDYAHDPEKDWLVSTDPSGHLTWSPPWPEVTHQEGIVSYFSDWNAPSPHEWLVKQKSLAWADLPYDDFILFTYRLHNESDQPVSGLYIGQFFDFDIGDPFANQGATDQSREMGYMYMDGAHPYAGVLLLHPAVTANISFIHNPTYLHATDYLEDAVKYEFLSGLDPIFRVPATTGPDDWGLVVSAGPFDLEPGETADVCLALVAGSNLGDLRANADAASVKFSELTTEVGDPVTPALPAHLVVGPNVPNPFNPSTEILYTVPRKCQVKVEIFNLLGRRVATLFDGVQEAGVQRLRWDAQSLSSGVYLARIKAGVETGVRKMMLLK